MNSRVPKERENEKRKEEKKYKKYFQDDNINSKRKCKIQCEARSGSILRYIKMFVTTLQI